MVRTPFAAGDALRERLRALAAGELVPAEPRPAATVVLLRDGADGPDVYLMRRRTTMAFAAGLHVFPGGGVDGSDADPVASWFGEPPRWWADRIGCKSDEARGLVVAAARETFEEAGVLLAGDAPSRVLADAADDVWEARRRALAAHETSLAAVLAEGALGLRADLLAPWSRWVTPEAEPRRYDTAFFVAALPEGQRTRDVSTESQDVAWVPLRRAADDEGLAMMPPTRVTCAELAGHPTVADVLASAVDRPVPLVRPRMVLEDGEVWVERDEEPVR